MLVVDIGPIKESKGDSLQVNLSCPGSLIGPPRDDVDFSGPVTVSADVVNLGSYIVVSGKITTKLSSPCSRCLTNTELSMKIPLQEEYRQSGSFEGEEMSEEDGIADDSRTFSGDKVDLTDAVRDAIIMATPIRFLCRDDCDGLCPICGTDLNVSSCTCTPPTDPRMSVLAKLLKPQEPAE